MVKEKSKIKRMGISREIEIPKYIEAEVEENKLIVKSSSGILEREFPFKLEIKGGKIVISTNRSTRREGKILGTGESHIRNMFAGLEKPFEYKLQICSVHFPVTVNVSPDKKFLTIKNFLGENIERKARIIENVEVKVEKDIITVKSADKEAAGQTAANIEKTTKVKKKDRRIFQDGIFIIEKPGKKIL